MTDHQVLLKRALTAIDDLERRLAASEQAGREPLAVIGMSCRFPGADSPDALWRLLSEGVDAISTFPEARWLDATGRPAGDTILPSGGFIDDIDMFDAAFFGISPREASTLDPQQRLVLEGVWRALEDAALRPEGLVGSSTGVFVGITTSDYGQLTRDGADDVYVATGAALNAASGRVSYVLGLQGPCMAIDTACSSSLVALHAGCQSLRNADCDVALVAGVNALLSPRSFALFRRWGMLAPDGRCKTFDASADGFSRGEGCGVLVLKRMRDAVAAGDRILAIIKGSAVNQDGRSSGLSVPNGPAQEKVLRAALSRAQLAPADVDYVEAHGTGTVLGDPIEVEALGAVYGRGRASGQPLCIGSIKTNVGHLESASGVAGVCKVILSLQEQAIPPHLHFDHPNPRIPWDELAVSVPTKLTPWPRGDRPRRAGVSSFGFTGTNAHVILEEAPVATPESVIAAPARAIPISVRTPSALSPLASTWANALEHERGPDLASASRTAAMGRARFEHRAVVVAGSAADAGQALRSIAVPRAAGQPPSIAFLFSGQGSQSPGMGRELYETSSVARDTLDRCAALCQDHWNVALLDALFDPDPSTLRDTAVAQPALFALELALARVWDSWGVRPAAVLGHSLGEYAAACVAGIMSVDDGFRLVAERGRLMATLPAGGAMAVVFAASAELTSFIDVQPTLLSLAAVNGDDSSVLSGERAAVTAACRELATRGVETRLLDVSHAFHSPLMDSILDDFEAHVGRIATRPPTIPLAGNVDGLLMSTVAPDAKYWRRHIREPVQFAACVRAVEALGCNTFIEIGPGSTLLKMTRRIVAGDDALCVPSLESGAEWRTLLRAAGVLWERGGEVDWDAVTAPHGGRRVALPGHPFDRKRYWVAPTIGPRSSEDGLGVRGHPLLGSRVDVAADGLYVWTASVDLDGLPWVGDHRVQGSAILPATAYLEIAFAAAHQVLGQGGVTATDLENEQPLFLRSEDRWTLQTILSREGEGSWRFEVHGRDAAAQSSWKRLVRGTLAPIPEAPSQAVPFDPAAVRERCPDRLDGASFYRRLADKGNQWGPLFQGMVEAWRGPGEAVARVRLPDGLAEDVDRFRFHPALADAAGHVLVASRALDRSAEATGGALVGGGISEVRLHRAPTRELWAHATVTSEGVAAENVVTGDVRVYDSDGQLVSETLGARLWYLQETAGGHSGDDLFYDVDWRPWLPDARVVDPTPPRRWCVLADDHGVGEELASLLSEAGGDVLIVRAGGQRDARPGAVMIDAACSDDWERLTSRLARGKGPVGLVFLWGLGLDRHVTDADPLERLMAIGPGSVQQLAAAAVKSRLECRLWIVTRGAQHVVEGDAVHPLGATLWGFGRAVGAEHAEMGGWLVDLDPGHAPKRAADALGEIVLTRADDRAIAMRGSQLYGARLRRIKPPKNEPSLAIDGTCLISGGLGGIGLVVAQRLVDRGCRSLVLLGRTVPPADVPTTDARWGPVLQAVERLRACGASVLVASVDVTDQGQVRDLQRSLDGRGVSPVRALFHAAGILQYGAVTAMRPSDLRDVLDPKVRGSLNLVEIFGDTARQTVFFSSSSAILPSPLMAGYAAANAYLDALTQTMREEGKSVISIGWGTWGEAGMATRVERQSATTALRSFGNTEALDALEAVMRGDLGRVAVMRMDWREWARLYPHFSQDPFFADVIETGNTTGGGDVAFDRQAFLSMENGPRRDALGEYLSRCFEHILGVEKDELRRGVPVSQLGFDSLMALEAKNRIESDLGVVVPLVQLLAGPSVDEMAGELLSMVPDGPGDDPVTPEVAWVEGEI